MELIQFAAEAKACRQQEESLAAYRVDPDLLPHFASNMTKTLGAIDAHGLQTSIAKHAQHLGIFCTHFTLCSMTKGSSFFLASGQALSINTLTVFLEDKLTLLLALVLTCSIHQSCSRLADSWQGLQPKWVDYSLTPSPVLSSLSC